MFRGRTDVQVRVVASHYWHQSELSKTEKKEEESRTGGEKTERAQKIVAGRNRRRMLYGKDHQVNHRCRVRAWCHV